MRNPKRKQPPLGWLFVMVVDPAGIRHPPQPLRLQAQGRSRARRMRLETPARPAWTRVQFHNKYDRKNATAHPIGPAVAFLWWTRRELNPRPKAIDGQDYMLSSVI